MTNVYNFLCLRIPSCVTGPWSCPVTRASSSSASSSISRYVGNAKYASLCIYNAHFKISCLPALSNFPLTFSKFSRLHFFPLPLRSTPPRASTADGTRASASPLPPPRPSRPRSCSPCRGAAPRTRRRRPSAPAPSPRSTSRRSGARCGRLLYLVFLCCAVLCCDVLYHRRSSLTFGLNKKKVLKRFLNFCPFLKHFSFLYVTEPVHRGHQLRSHRVVGCSGSMGFSCRGAGFDHRRHIFPFSRSLFVP